MASRTRNTDNAIFEIEKALSHQYHTVSFTSSSFDGVCLVLAEFNWNSKQEDRNYSLQEVHKPVESISKR